MHTTTSKLISAILFVAAAAAVATAQPASFIDLGVIGTPGTYTFDTIGSQTVPAAGSTGMPADLDTELGLWDSAGTLIVQDDDGAGIAFFSQITETLGPGTFFLGSSEFDSDFMDGFVNAGTGFEAGEVGNVLLNIDGALAGSGMAGNADTGFDQTVFFSVTVEEVPEPASAALLAIAGLACCLMGRRRK